MEDYYKILGISSSATAAEIKRAYRKKAKELHPDLSHNETESEAFRSLVVAYKVLSDLHQRSLFDANYAMRSRYSKGRRNEDFFNYRAWLLERKDQESMCKLIFWDLMHNREDDAVAEFKKMNTEIAGFKLSNWFTREDFMDYGFILAEELVFRAEYYDAFLLLEQIIHMEFSFSYFKHFFPEVQALVKDILRRHIETSVNDELAIDAWERALDLRLGKKEDGYYLLKMAEAYNRLGDSYTAQICLKEAIKLDNTLHISEILRRRYSL